MSSLWSMRNISLIFLVHQVCPRAPVSDKLSLLSLSLTVSAVWDGRSKPDGVKSLIVIRDQKEHIRRRKPWNRAFSMSAMKDYEPALQKRASQLMRELEKKATIGDPINLRDWMTSFTYETWCNPPFVSVLTGVIVLISWVI